MTTKHTGKSSTSQFSLSLLSNIILYSTTLVQIKNVHYDLAMQSIEQKVCKFFKYFVISFIRIYVFTLSVAGPLVKVH